MDTTATKSWLRPATDEFLTIAKCQSNKSGGMRYRFAALRLLMASRRRAISRPRHPFHRPLRPPRRSGRRPFPVARNPGGSRSSRPRSDRTPTLAAAFCRHSITSLANPMTEGGIVIPSAFAVLRLMTSSSLGRISHWQVARLGSLQNLRCIGARTHAPKIVTVKAIANQTPRLDVLSKTERQSALVL